MTASASAYLLAVPFQVEFGRLAEPAPVVPEEFVFRPLYSRGREVWVSDDSAHLHSTPDRQFRECLWRFM